MKTPRTIEEAQSQLRMAITGSELQTLAKIGLREQNRWGGFALSALRRLGEYLNMTPRLRGRPKKESSVDSLRHRPPYRRLGLEGRGGASSDF
jgi:hypothetical protein